MLLSASSLSSLLLALLSVLSFSLWYCRRRHYIAFTSVNIVIVHLFATVIVVIIIAFSSVIITIFLRFMLLSSSSLLSLLLVLLSLSPFYLCYCRRRNYHRSYWCNYRNRPSLYVIVVAVIIIAVTRVIIFIVFLSMLLSSS